MQVVKAIAHFETILVDAITKDSLSMVLDSISTPAGNLPAGTYGFVIEQESNSKREYVIGTLSGSTLTFTHRDVSPLDAETTSSSADDQRKSHRKGASIKLSNFPVLTILARILSGDAELDADTPIVLDAARTPTSANELVTKAWVESVINGGTVYYETQIVRGDAGETIDAAGRLLYLKESDGEWYKVNTANTDWKNKRLGISQGAGTNGNAITGGVLVSGLDTSISYTAGQLYYGTDVAGVIGTAAGSEALVIGVGDANNRLVFFDDAYQLTDDEKDALAGSQGHPDASNKFVTQDNITVDTTLEDETVSTNSIEVGEVDATGKKNTIAEKFVASKTKMRGVKLFKKADLGTFSGTVTVTLEADTAGEPSGSALATATLTNAQWLALIAGFEIEVLFASEYASLVAGSTYWIKIATSTADNSNHPNFGGRTSGGNGSLYYNNTTDDWTQLANSNLYYKVMEGNAGQVVKTGSDGKIPNNLINTPTLMGFQQTIPQVAATAQARATGSNQDGSVFYTYDNANNLRRFARDANTGMYFLTHTVSGGIISPPAGDTGAIVVVGNYVYVFHNDNTNIICARYLAADLTGETAITEPVVSCTGNVIAWTDGTYIYIVSEQSDTTCRKWSISGTTLSAVDTQTITTGIFGVTDQSSMFDGTYAYVITANLGGANGGYRIYKLRDFYGVASVATDVEQIDYSDRQDGAFIINLNSKCMYIGVSASIYDETGVIKEMIMLTPVTKP